MTSVGRIVEIFREITGCEITVLERPVRGPMKFIADMTTMNRIIDWQPKVSIEEGVRRAYEKTPEWMNHGTPDAHALAVGMSLSTERLRSRSDK